MPNKVVTIIRQHKMLPLQKLIVAAPSYGAFYHVLLGGGSGSPDRRAPSTMRRRASPQPYLVPESASSQQSPRSHRGYVASNTGASGSRSLVTLAPIAASNYDLNIISVIIMLNETPLDSIQNHVTAFSLVR